MATFTPTAPPGLRTNTVLPELPLGPNDHQRYLIQLDAALRDLYADLSRRLQFFITNTAMFSETLGYVAFGAADVSQVVTFQSPEDDAAYIPLLTPSWLTTLSANSVASTGFTINAGTAPGGGGGAVLYLVAR